MKKLIVFVLIISMLALAVACSGGTTTTGTTQATTKGSTNTTGTTSTTKGSGLNAPGVFPVSDEPITLKFLTRYFGEGSGKYDLNTNDVTLMLEEKTNIHIEWDHLPAEDAATKLNLIIVGGEYPDVLFEFPVDQSKILEWSEEGIILPQNNYIENNTINYRKILQDREDIRIATTAPDGNIYSWARTDGGIHILVNTKIFVYDAWRTQYMEATGSKVETTADYKAMLTYFRDNDMNGNGNNSDEIPISGLSAQLIESLLNPFVYGKSMYLNNGMITVNFDQEQYREGLRYIKSLWDEKLLDEELFTQNGSQVTALVNQASISEMIVGGFCGLWDGGFINPAVVPYEAYKGVAPLIGPDGTRQTVYSKADVKAGYGIIFNTCENPEAFIQWMDYLYSEEGTILMAYGIEGVSWDWVDYPSLDGDPKSVSRTKPVGTLYEMNVQWIATAPCYRTPAIKYLETAQPGQSGASLYNSSMLYMPHANPDQAIPTNMWLTADQASQLALYKASIDEYVAEAAAGFIVGELDLNGGWDQYLAQLKAMDLSGYIALNQEIFDANTK
ncbi:MAG: hypothetical protein SCM11_01145 [Bacillota bacterium]|nr:hypothetical protein [Bacillota bacterium]